MNRGRVTQAPSIATGRARQVDPSGASRQGNTFAKQEQMEWRDIVFISPLFLALLASTLSLQKAEIDQVATSVLQEGDPSRLYIFGGIYVLALILVISRIRVMSNILRTHWSYALFLVYVIASAAWSAYPQKVLLNWGHFVGTTLVCLAAIPPMQRNEQTLFKVIVAYGAIAVGLSVLTVLVFPSRGIMDLGGKLRWVGLTWTPNILGIIALISIWGAAAQLFYAKRIKSKAFLVLLILLSAIALYGANSVTSIVLSMMVLLITMSSIYIRGKGRTQKTLIVFFISMMLLIFVFVAYVVAPDIFSTETLFHLAGRSSTLTGRTGLWEIASSAINDKPMLGWGFDALMSLGYKYRIQYGQFHNGYLDLLVRGGWVALSFIFVFGAIILVQLIRLARINYWQFVSLAVLFGVILIHNVTEASLGRPPHAMWLLFTLLFLYLNRATINGMRLKQESAAGKAATGHR